MDLKQTLFEIDERDIATATFNRPDVHNVIGPVFMDDMHRVMDRVEDGGVRALILTGAGESFCAGGDLGWMKQQVAQSRAERIGGSQQLARFFRRFDRLPVLTIARVNGQAYGGGLGVICVCDIAFAVPGAKFAITEPSLGLAPSNISPFVVKRMGAANARRVCLNAKPMDAELAQRLGLVTEVTDDLDAAIERELKGLLRCGPEAVSATKRLIEWVDQHGPEDNAFYTSRDLADAWEREEGKEGITAFLEKRKPAWRG